MTKHIMTRTAALALLLGVAAAMPALAQNYYYVVPQPSTTFTSSFSDNLYDMTSGQAAARVQNQHLQNEILRQQIELNRLRLQQQQR